MKTLAITIDNRGDYCGKCKYKIHVGTIYQGKLNYYCGIFNKPIQRTVAGRKLVCVDECELLQEEGGEVKPILIAVIIVWLAPLIGILIGLSLELLTETNGWIVVFTFSLPLSCFALVIAIWLIKEILEQL